MTMAQIKIAADIVDNQAERMSRMSVDGGGYCLSVTFVGGWSRIFYTLESVREWRDHYDTRCTC